MTTQFFSDAGSGGTTADWHPYFGSSTNGVYAVAHDSAVGDYPSSATATTLYATTFRQSGIAYVIGRPLMTFNTSVIGVGSTITSASMNLYEAGSSNLTLDSYMIVAANPASNNSYTASDYGSAFTTHSDTSFSTVAGASIVTSAYNVFTLNASGIANINKTGISKFGIRCLSEATDTTSHTNGRTDALNVFFNFFAADNGTNKPYLEVTYTTGSTANNILLLGVK